MIGLWARAHRDAQLTLAVGAERRRFGRLVGGISRLAQLVRDELDAEFLSGSHFARSSVDLGSLREERLFEPLIHDAFVLEVVKAEDAGKNQRSYGDPQQRDAQREHRPWMLSGGLRQFDLD